MLRKSSTKVPTRKELIVIGIPDNHDTFKKPFVLSLAGLIGFTHDWMRITKRQMDIRIIQGDKGRYEDMRNAVAYAALEAKADYIFWMDSDMTFPQDALARLYEGMEFLGAEAMSGLYTRKVPPYMPHVYAKLLDNGRFAVGAEFPIDKPFFVEGAGFGCLLMKTSVFDRMERPYFKITIKDGQMVEGEDLVFCREAKMKMLVEPRVSCGHLYERAFDINDYLCYNTLEVKKKFVVVPSAKRLEIGKATGLKQMNLKDTKRKG